MYQEFPLFLLSPFLQWSLSWSWRSVFIAWSTLLWIKCWHYGGDMHTEPNLSKVHRLPSQVKGSPLFHPWFNKLKSVNREVWSPASKCQNKYHNLGLSQHPLGLDCIHEWTSNTDIIPACNVQENPGAPIPKWLIRIHEGMSKGMPWRKWGHGDCLSGENEENHAFLPLPLTYSSTRAKILLLRMTSLRYLLVVLLYAYAARGLILIRKLLHTCPF